MQNDEHKGIKYLMKELDPSEAVLFEQRMMEDEELLLEVECMRRTLRRLEKLPLERPPRHLTEQIVRKACSCSQNKSNRSDFLPYRTANKSFAKYYAATALILVGVGMGIISIQYSESTPDTTATQQRVSKADFGGGSDFNDKASLDPWVDKNDVIYINQPSGNSEGTNFMLDSALNNNSDYFQTLEPTFWQDRDRMSNGTVRLTGSRR